jgi:signal peptide peptidase SppA
MIRNNPLLARFLNEPSLIEPMQGDRVMACLGATVAHPRYGELSFSAGIGIDDDFWEEMEWCRPYTVVDGTLRIPISGVLLNHFPYVIEGGATGYDYIQRAFDRGMEDMNVTTIALVIDSPGGMVAGNFDLVDNMFARRGEKAIVAYAAESAYSAAYSIASVADRIVVTRTGGVGSVGVVTMHVDISKALDEAGLKVTYVYAGKHKVDGNQYQPLPDDVKARIQSRVDELYDVFVSTVARNRGMDEQVIRDTEALTFTATQAVSNGFADAIGTIDSELSTTTGDDEMSKPQDNTAVDATAFDARYQEGLSAGRAEAAAAAATGERERIAAILDCSEAEGRDTLARHFAFKTGMSPEDAKAALEAAPKLEATAPGRASGEGATFDDLMAHGNPDVGADGDNVVQMSVADRILTARYGSAKSA